MSQFLFDPSISFSLWGGTKDARLASFVGGDILSLAVATKLYPMAITMRRCTNDEANFSMCGVVLLANGRGSLLAHHSLAATYDVLGWAKWSCQARSSKSSLRIPTAR